MRWLVLTVALTGLCSVAQAREPLARLLERTPSIMVGGEIDKPPKLKRQKAPRPEVSRSRTPRVTRTRPLVVPQPSASSEAETRSINRSMSEQLQDQQLQQRQQSDINLLRQEIRRDAISPLGCTPGSLSC
jgi:hypothetical protein